MGRRNTHQVGQTGRDLVAKILKSKNFRTVDLFGSELFVRGKKKDFIVQVRTRTWGVGLQKKGWTLSKADETSNSNFYVFVDLIDPETPKYHIVPSSFVSSYIEADHKWWSEQIDEKTGKPHGEGGGGRTFYDDRNYFLNRWDLLD